MLADGTNPEGVDPSPPLNWKDAKDLKDVVLYGTKFSPPCAKIQSHLKYCKVNFETVNGKNEESEYKKIPALKVQGRQVNDSFIIMKHLIPILYEGETFDFEWEKKITYGVQIAMEIESFNDGESTLDIATKMGGFNCCLARFLTACCCCLLPIGPNSCSPMARRIEAKRSSPANVKKYGPLRDFEDYLKEFRAALKGGPFFDGRKRPSAVDVSMYGTIYRWEILPFVQKALQSSDLNAWLGRMKDAHGLS